MRFQISHQQTFRMPHLVRRGFRRRHSQTPTTSWRTFNHLRCPPSQKLRIILTPRVVRIKLRIRKVSLYHHHHLFIFPSVDPPHIPSPSSAINDLILLTLFCFANRDQRHASAPVVVVVFNRARRAPTRVPSLPSSRRNVRTLSFPLRLRAPPSPLLYPLFPPTHTRSNSSLPPVPL